MARLNLKASSSVPSVTNRIEEVVQESITSTRLKRILATAMMWDDTFYKSGEQAARELKDAVFACYPETIGKICVDNRVRLNIRHASLYAMVCLAKGLENRNGLNTSLQRANYARISRAIRQYLPDVINRPDELGEFLAMYWKDGKCPIPACVKKALAQAFGKFNEYQFAKWDRDSSIKLRDVMFLTHPKPKGLEQISLFNRIANRTLQTPDTWETELSAGKDKCETFTRLINEKKLGDMAFIMNLRNMRDSGVNIELISREFATRSFAKVFPFRFLTVAEHVPGMEHLLEEAFYRAADALPKLPGRTGILIDTSGSMTDPIGDGKRKGDPLPAVKVATSLAIVAREICEDPAVGIFGTTYAPLPSYARGLMLGQYVKIGQVGHGTNIGSSLMQANMDNWGRGRGWVPDRVIVITDMQSGDHVRSQVAPRSYFLNVMPYTGGVQTATNNWHVISGWSDKVLEYIAEIERIG